MDEAQTIPVRYGLATFVDNAKLRLLMGTLLYLAQGISDHYTRYIAGGGS